MLEQGQIIEETDDTQDSNGPTSPTAKRRPTLAGAIKIPGAAQDPLKRQVRTKDNEDSLLSCLQMNQCSCYSLLFCLFPPQLGNEIHLRL